ncbi:MAG: ribosome biogenesis GTPase YlqF [Ruminococcaceae bacterium]|nr:ribosome biogenesis GTPase YlqF [Oscillospiraceae bacterium]
MAKTRRVIAENLKLVDIVLEIADARIPQSSRNPDLAAILGTKPRLLILNKIDIADANATAQWEKKLTAQGENVLCADCLSGAGLNKLMPKIQNVLSEKLERFKSRGLTGLAVRAMVVGVPNSGKSSLINRLAGQKAAKVEDRPGVTRTKQWIHAGKQLELLDTPGILWPKFEDKQVGLHLAFTGAVRDEVTDIETLASELLKVLAAKYPDALTARYKMTPDASAEGIDLLYQLCRKRGFIMAGNEPDTERGAKILLDEFRGGKLGRITLE